LISPFLDIPSSTGTINHRNKEGYAGGIKFMRDTLFGKLISPFPFLWLQFVVGVIFFVIGFGFFAGFLLHRDRKNGKVAPRFQKK